MKSEQLRKLKIERFGYDPTIKETFLGDSIVNGNLYSFYLKQDYSIDVCHHGCNGTLMCGEMDAEAETTNLSPEFSQAFLILWQAHKRGELPPKKPINQDEIEKLMKAYFELDS